LIDSFIHSLIALVKSDATSFPGSL